MRSARGFTLVELITVIVVLAIVAALGSGFVVTVVDSYKGTQERAKLVQKGRLAIEQMSRQLRSALPHSLRLSSSGNCLEFMPIVGGANYLEPVPTAQNGMAAKQVIDTAPFSIGLGVGNHVVIGALSPDEIYTFVNPASRVATASPVTGGPHSSVQLTSTTHKFLRNSINRRLFVADNPVRFCLVANQLEQYSGYGLDTSAPISDGNPGGNASLIVTDVNAASAAGAFALSGGSEDRNTAVVMGLVFQQGGTSVELRHQVLVRNVP